MNLPNKLSVLRLIMVPIFMVVMLLPVFTDFKPLVDTILTLAGAFLFIAASLTDMLDGKIARKYNLVTDFGKFLDPLADKFMVIGAMLCILFTNAGNIRMFTLYFFALVVVVFRELAVTSIRLVAASGKQKVVIAANMLGKLKTVTQIVAICAAIIEPVIYSALGVNVNVLGFAPLTLITTVAMIYLTIHSGINYIVGAWKYLDPQK
ncbi:MAG: CDP-diacylglycerol--glycerol-3-phosphate 3-phosphatidyltransferase [Ruminococcaceae bacterium]|nr:CDP-diacylglycerol--glycerol-3-phosphate 3-phosphatidyltransferase [Oscillospiraceae bacterium]